MFHQKRKDAWLTSALSPAPFGQPTDCPASHSIEAYCSVHVNSAETSCLKKLTLWISQLERILAPKRKGRPLAGLTPPRFTVRVRQKKRRRTMASRQLSKLPTARPMALQHCVGRPRTSRLSVPTDAFDSPHDARAARTSRILLSTGEGERSSNSTWLRQLRVRRRSRCRRAGSPRQLRPRRDRPSHSATGIIDPSRSDASVRSRISEIVEAP